MGEFGGVEAEKLAGGFRVPDLAFFEHGDLVGGEGGTGQEAFRDRGQKAAERKGDGE